jgi:hypothetical protein
LGTPQYGYLSGSEGPVEVQLSPIFAGFPENPACPRAYQVVKYTNKLRLEVPLR